MADHHIIVIISTFLIHEFLLHSSIFRVVVANNRQNVIVKFAKNNIYIINMPFVHAQGST